MAMGFFAVFDDIAVLLDDAAAMTKVATQKTAGILGDDLAVNAQKASGFASHREIPVLWAIAKGSFRNKLIILPMAFLLSAFAPWIIIPILMLGGIYLAYEGTEKIYEYFYPHEKEKIKTDFTQEFTQEEILEIEKTKIKSAIFTDFILSIEIIVMALGTVMEQTIQIQIIAVTMVSIIATIGVYGVVAMIIRMDDLGLKFIAMDEGKQGFLAGVGGVLVSALPKVIKYLTVIGTIAMLLVAGGIFTHNVHQIHDALNFLPALFRDVSVGLVIGAIALTLQTGLMKLKN